MKPFEISSSANAQFKIWQSLLTSKGIKEHQQFFLMGRKLIEEFLTRPNENFKAEYLIYYQAAGIESNIKQTILSKDLFKELDVLATNAPMLILSFHPFVTANLNKDPEGLEIVCPLGDPRNMGALIRSAVGFGVRQMILTQEATHPFLPNSIKASAGAALKMKFLSINAKLGLLPLVGENFALELHGTDLAKVLWPKNLRLWVGEEGPGLQLAHEQKRSMKFIHIPTSEIESLNATTSTTLALWEWKKSH